MREYWINSNGVETRMSPREVEAMEKDQAGLPPPVPTGEQELRELKRQAGEMRRMIEALASGGAGEAEV